MENCVRLDGFEEVSAILRSGVYALCAKGQVIYVGKSKAMLARVNAHRRAFMDKKRGQAWITESLGIPGLRFDEIHICPVPLHLLDRVEAEMIERYKPRYNIQLKTSQKVSTPVTLSIRGSDFVLNAPLETAQIVRRV